MPYDKNGKYYRKPVYKIEKIKKDLPLKKKRRFSFFIFSFYIFGLISPLVLYSVLTISLYFLLSNSIFPSALTVIIFIFSVSIIYGLLTKRFHKFQLKKYIEQGGKIRPSKITRLAILWWIAILIPFLISGLMISGYLLGLMLLWILSD